VNPRRWLLVLLAAAVLVPSVGWGVAAVGYRQFGPPVVTNALVRRTEAEVRREFGTPVSEQDGYSGLGAGPHAAPPPGPVKTLIFRPGGLRHPAGGWQWVWLVFDGRDWICFESCWFGDHVRF
jgi:hypothetical protein